MGPPRTPPANSWGQAGCTSPLRTPLWDPNPSAETPQLYPNVPPPHHSRLGDPPGDRPNPPTPPGGHSRSRGCSRAARRPCADPSGGSPTRPRAASPPPSPHLWDGKCIRPPLTPPAPTGPPPPLTHVVLAGDVAQDGVALGQFDVAINEIGQLGGGGGEGGSEPWQPPHFTSPPPPAPLTLGKSRPSFSFSLVQSLGSKSGAA